MGTSAGGSRPQTLAGGRFGRPAPAAAQPLANPQPKSWDPLGGRSPSKGADGVPDLGDVVPARRHAERGRASCPEAHLGVVAAPSGRMPQLGDQSAGAGSRDRGI